jgi:hypothetical protein
MTNGVWKVLPILVAGALAGPAWASIPPHGIDLVLNLDVRNVTGPRGAGSLPLSDLKAGVEAANRVWEQCSIRFVAKHAANVAADELGVAYEPRSQDDLSRLASALNPHGFGDEIPLTIAGPWRFYDSQSGLYLTGLGWVFTKDSGGIDRIGAMIGSQKIHAPVAGLIIAHELAHALSLPHVSEKDNLMGPGGTFRLTPGQCQQAREFAGTSLRAFKASM